MTHPAHEMTRELPMTVTTDPYDAADDARAERGTWWRDRCREAGYSITAFPVVLVGFVLAVVGVSVGVGALVVVVGLPLLVVTVLVARGFADLERYRMRTLLGREAPRPTYLVADPAAGPVRRLLTPLRDVGSWLDVLWSLLGFATGVTAFAVTVGWIGGTLGGLSYGFWQRWIPLGPHDTLAYRIGLGAGRQPEIWLNLALGVVGLVLLPLVVRLVAVLHAGLAHALLCARAELQQEVRRVSGGRDAARAAEAGSLRRLERDIHDGPQQRLVRLQMDLGRAGKQLEHDPVQARATLDGALVQAREAVEELRALSRGIAPPVLVDRGLEAALGEAFARSAVPVHADIDLPGELAPHVETAVYFVVAEALTNVAKHSGATRADVVVRHDGDRVRIQVADDGRGGAHVSKGRGLAGLEERVRAADGSLRIASPDGGPTLLSAEVGCR